MPDQAPKDESPSKKQPDKHQPNPQPKATDEHLRVMGEYIFKREGRRATLNEAQEALDNMTRLMKWLYEHRNDLKKKKP